MLELERSFLNPCKVCLKTPPKWRELEVRHSYKVLLLILDILNNSNSHDDFTVNTANRENWGNKKTAWLSCAGNAL